MKLTLLQENLKLALNHLQKAIPSKPQLPILSSIVLETVDHSLSLAATDLYLGIKTRVEADVKKKGKFVIPGEIFKKLIFSLSPGEISLQVIKTSLIIKTENSKTSLPIHDAGEYPPFPEIKGKTISFSLEDLQKIEKRVSFSVTTDQTRPVLTSILFNFKTDSLEVVGTDGFRLATQQIESGLGKEEQLLIPAKALIEVVRIASQQQEDDVSFTVSGKLKQVLCKINQTEVFVRLIEGAYPPYEKIIPPDFRLEAEMDGEELLAQVKRAFVFARESSNIIRLQVKADKLIISSASPAQGEYQGNIAIKNLKQEDGEIAFNALYLLDFLNNVRPTKVWFGMNESLKPAMFKTEEAVGYQYVVMPFRVNS